MNWDRFGIARQSIGARDTAEATARRAIREVKAYKAFLESRKIATGTPLDALPVQDKASYMQSYPFADLLGGDFADTFTIFRSAGSAGHSFYWPQLKSSYTGSSAQLRALLENLFLIDQKKTMAIVGLALGSWIGGDVLSWALKDVSVSSSYPFAVFSPGSKHDEIIAMLTAAEGMVEQFLLVCCPSAIAHLVSRASELGHRLPLEKMRYLVIGEAFPEQLRTDLGVRARCKPGETLMASVYGSADTGVLGFELPASIMLRKLCISDPRVADALGITGVTPHFFHHADPHAFLEDVGEELCVSKWQGIPLIRYNLHDRAKLFEWPEIVDRLSLVEPQDEQFSDAISLMRATSAILPQTGVIAISGRADFCLVLCGTKLTEAMLDEALLSAQFKDLLTGAYEAEVILEDGRQRLRILLEHHPIAERTASMLDHLYPQLIQAIGRAQPEFLDDWSNIYAAWDNDPARRILKLEATPWPRLSERNQGDIKRHSIIP